MRKYILSIALAASMLFVGCSSEDTPTGEGSAANVTLSETKVSVGPDATSVEVSVKSTGKWYLSGNYDWVTPSAVEGSNGATVTFAINENVSDESLEATYKFFTGDYVQTFKVMSSPTMRLELLTDAHNEFSNGAAALNVGMDSNAADLAQTVSEGTAEWLVFDKFLDGLGGKKYAQYTVTANEGYAPRNSEITITGAGKSITVTVAQAQTDAILFEQPEQFDLAAKTISVEIQANVNYTAATSDDWITITAEPVAREEGVVGLTTQTIVFEATEAASSRAGKVTLTSEELGSITINVLQVDPSATVVAFEDANFVKALADAGHILALGDSAGIMLGDYTTVETISLSSKSITSIKGIEAFTGLKTLSVDKNSIKEIDLSALTGVESLALTGNPLEMVNLGDNPIKSLSFQQYYAFAAGGSWNGAYSSACVFISSQLESVYMYNSCYRGADEMNFKQCPMLNSLTLGSWYTPEKVILSAEHHEGKITVDKSDVVVYE